MHTPPRLPILPFVEDQHVPRQQRVGGRMGDYRNVAEIILVANKASKGTSSAIAMKTRADASGRQLGHPRRPFVAPCLSGYPVM